MLKLTISFYRCVKPSCENFSYKISHVNFSHLNCRTKTCSSVFNQSHISLIPFIHNNQQWRLLANKMKSLHAKKSFTVTNAEKTGNPMSEPLQPTSSNVSYGGQFVIESNFSNHCKEEQKVPGNFRIWEPVDNWNACNGNGFKFKIMSYNVLAQYLLERHPYLYTQCPPQDLKWKVRSARLYEEILSYDPDILCLQEVQASHIKSFYSKFQKIGYCGIFKQKTGHRHDGCAIYFKRSMFHLEDHISVEYYQPELPLLNRDNVGLALKLSPRGASAPNTSLVVATTHLLYNPKRTDVRLAQIQLFLAEIDRFAYYNTGTKSEHYPIVLTGDFNSLPDSVVVKLLSRGHVRASLFRDNSDWRKIGVTDSCQHLSVYLNRLQGTVVDDSMIKIFNSERAGEGQTESEADGELWSEEDYGALFNTGELDHGLRLMSVYPQRKHDGSPEATTFQDCWVTVDYIYFSRCSTLRLLERLRLPTEEECSKMGLLPNHKYASDHFALAALFEFKSTSL